MEYLPSRSLAAVLTEDGVLRNDRVAQIGAQVADALAATHAAGIVHRDVKPANILIGEGGRVEGLVKITDFGISHASGDVTLTQTGQITGTPAFLAPEVAQGREMTEASDVFSLGATLYTCLEGQPPFGMEDNALGDAAPRGRREHPAAAAGRRPDRAAEEDARRRSRRPGPRCPRSATSWRRSRRAATATPPRCCSPAPTSRADAPGPGRTKTFPVPPPAEPAASAAPAAAPRAGRPAGSGRPTGSGRGPEGAPARPAEDPGPAAPVAALWVAVGAVALLLAGLIVFWAVGLDDGSDPSADPPASTSSAAESTSESPEQTDGGGDPAVVGATHRQRHRGRRRRRDHGQGRPRFPGGLPRPGARGSAHGLRHDDRADPPGERRLRDLRRVLGQVQRRQGQGRRRPRTARRTATASLEFTEDGEKFTEAHQFTLVVGPDGQLLMDSRPAGRLTHRCRTAASREGRRRCRSGGGGGI